MKQAIQYVNDAHYLAIGLLIALSFSIGTCFILFVRLNETISAKQTCASFSSYGAALQAYNAGNKGLDHNKNGYPCENLL